MTGLSDKAPTGLCSPLLFLQRKSHPSIFQEGNTWISVSYFLLDLIAGVSMSVILALLLLFRRSELIQVRTLESNHVVYLPTLK